jgi:G3E family GTPase
MLERIPVNLITGYLGVGKTTAIVNLLKEKPEDEKWAVLVNDFGEVSIDHLTLASEGDKELQVMEVEGGCICCSAAQNMHFSLQMMLTRLRPNRILIEPTGMGILPAFWICCAVVPFQMIFTLIPQFVS